MADLVREWNRQPHLPPHDAEGRSLAPAAVVGQALSLAKRALDMAEVATEGVIDPEWSRWYQAIMAAKAALEVLE